MATEAQLRERMRRTVVRMRDKEHKTWKAIGDEFGISPSLARTLYDEKRGNGAHYGLLPGKGGRTAAA